MRKKGVDNIGTPDFSSVRDDSKYCPICKKSFDKEDDYCRDCNRILGEIERHHDPKVENKTTATIVKDTKRLSTAVFENKKLVVKGLTLYSIGITLLIGFLFLGLVYCYFGWDKTQKDLTATQDVLRSTQERLKATQETLRSTQNRLDSTESELKATKITLTSTQNTLNAKVREIEGLEAQISQLSSELSETKYELAQTSKHLGQTEFELSQAKVVLAAISSDLSEVENRINYLTNYVNENAYLPESISSDLHTQYGDPVEGNIIDTCEIGRMMARRFSYRTDTGGDNVFNVEKFWDLRQGDCDDFAFFAAAWLRSEIMRVKKSGGTPIVSFGEVKQQCWLFFCSTKCDPTLLLTADDIEEKVVMACGTLKGGGGHCEVGVLGVNPKAAVFKKAPTSSLYVFEPQSGENQGLFTDEFTSPHALFTSDDYISFSGNAIEFRLSDIKERVDESRKNIEKFQETT